MNNGQINTRSNLGEIANLTLTNLILDLSRGEDSSPYNSVHNNDIEGSLRTIMYSFILDIIQNKYMIIDDIILF